MVPLVVCGLVFASLAAVAAEDNAPLTLAEAVRLALERHPDIGKAQASADVLKGRIREVRSAAFPEVSIGSNAMRWRDPSLLNASGLDKFPQELRDALVPSPVNIFDYSVSVKQPLYTAGKVGTALRLASIESEGSEIDIDRAKQNLALEVVKAFYGLLWAERYEKLVQETQQQKIRHAEMARVRFRNGVATEVDVLRSEVAVANGRPDLVRARNAIQQGRALLNYFVGRPVEFPTSIAGDFTEAGLEETDLEGLSREAIRRRPELMRLRVAERSAAAQLDLARAESRMRVDFSGAYGIVSRLPENLVDPLYARWSAGVNFTLPIFDGFRRSGMVWQATANGRAVKLEREKTEQQVRLNVQQGLDELAAARESVAAARATLRQAERVLEMTQANYQHGAATTLDVADAQTALAAARTNLLRGLHDSAVARASLRWTLGRTPWE
jgi:outer membrane protein